jgi:iron complex transport system substrate-binding protein
MSKKKISLIVLVVCLSLLMAVAVGCSNSDTEKTTTEPKTVTFTDSAERQVEVPAKVTKIVPSGPLAQIALFALAPDMLVGLSGKWDPAAEQYLDTKYYNLPVLGQFYGGKGDLNLEEIAKVDPQVIIDVGQ